ncbi:hypothetical protein QFC19_004768 [Naganishia cerealis]|uniref:Uncharacterized protein n=1 Tax=Naganishia cerealis TaxID=610337 RepID=A0ACC2VUI6_9TREE|nr:hypothetical protein QFC19_004768 [Naganishia cerealis]
MLVLAISETRFKILAKSLDDSIGDAFDKTAKLLQIPWLPGLGPGPSLESYAAPHATNPQVQARVEALLEEMKPFKPSAKGQRAFSFAGLKTQVLKETQKRHPNLQLKGKLGPPEPLKRAVATRFQQAAVKQVEDKVRIVLDYLEKDPEGKKLLPDGEPRVRAVVASGGVASNQYLRSQLKRSLEERTPADPIPLVFPPVSPSISPNQCKHNHLTHIRSIDNAAMIAWAGILKLRRQGGVGDSFGGLLRPKWSMEALEELAKDEEAIPPPEVTIVKI